MSRNEKLLQSNKTPPDHAGLLLAAILMSIGAWAGLAFLVLNSLPRIGGELWLFFVLLEVAVTGTVIPIVRFFNLRFTPIMADLPATGVIVRQSLWIGLFVVICAWLQIPRALSLPLAGFVALVFLVVEIFLRSREIASERN